VADSGTLEEIERVAMAGKPIMLYFSRVEIDPDRIEIDQFERLKQFREKIFSKGLVENYRRISEFRDKFSKQLEMKIRELQRGDALGNVPLSLELLSNDTGEPVGRTLEAVIEYPTVPKLAGVSADQEGEVRKLVDQHIRDVAYFPIALAIQNSSSSSVRSMYVELVITADSENVGVYSSLPTSNVWGTAWLRTSAFWGADEQSEAGIKIRQILSRYDSDLHKDATAGGWRLSFEWDALQPQRLRLIRPILYVLTFSDCEIGISAKIFSDFSPEPFDLEAKLKLKPRPIPTELGTLIPDWAERLERQKQDNLTLFSGFGSSAA
jgi:hypothetical protein